MQAVWGTTQEDERQDECRAHIRMIPSVDRILRTGTNEYIVIGAFTPHSDTQTAFNEEKGRQYRG
jgi:hypothetical protein